MFFYLNVLWVDFSFGAVIDWFLVEIAKIEQGVLRLEMLYGLFFQFKLLKVGIIFAFINAMS
jgi:hypothetical protein